MLIKDKYGYRLEGLAAVKTSGKRWHKLRASFIGGSDSSALANKFAREIGYSSITKYNTPLTLWQTKKGLKDEPTKTAAMARGIRRETGLRQAFKSVFEEEYGYKPKVYTQKYTYTKEINGVKIGGNLDGIVLCNNGELAGLEIKTANFFNGGDWQDGGLPTSYYCQVQHYMLLTSLNKFYVLAEIGDELLLREVPFNQDFCEKLLKEYAVFQSQLENNLEPEPLGYDCELEQAKVEQQTELYEQRDDLSAVLDELVAVKGMLSGVEERKSQLENVIKIAIGINEGITIAGQVVTYKQNKNSIKFDSKKFMAEHQELYNLYSYEQLGARVLKIK